MSRLVAGSADAVVTVSDAIAEDIRAQRPTGPVVTIANGADFDDFDDLEYSRGDSFRITHTGSFFGRRDPKPFFHALRQVERVEARFVGDSRASDRDWTEALGLGDRVEWIPFVPRRRSLELQRQSEALLLLVPEAEGRGRGILSGKVFEYLAAGRPILAMVPPDGAAAKLLRETGAGVVIAPDDVDEMARQLVALRDRWRDGDDLESRLTPDWRARLSRGTRARELAALLSEVASPQGVGRGSARVAADEIAGGGR